MELHAVHFNTKFGSSLIESLKNAGKAYNALAVLAVMFEVQDEDNPLIQPIVDGELDVSLFFHWRGLLVIFMSPWTNEYISIT